MHYLISLGILASHGIIFRTEEETTAFAHCISKELLRRLSSKGLVSTNQPYSSFTERFENDPEWKAAFIHTIQDLLEETEQKLENLHGHLHSGSESLDSVSVDCLYLSTVCKARLSAQGIQTIKDLIDASKNITLLLPVEDLIEIRKRGEWLLPAVLS